LGWTSVWAPLHVRLLWLTLLWVGGGIAMTLYGRLRPWRTMFVTGWVVLVGTASVWLAVDTLAFRVASGVRPALPFANLQFAVGVAAAAMLMIATWLTRRRTAGAVAGEWLSGKLAWIPVLATLLVLWGMSLEVERAIGRYEASRPAGWLPLWPPLQARLLWWTLLWATGGLFMTLYGRLRSLRTMLVTGWPVLIGAALTWLTFDTIVWRVTSGIVLATPVANLQFAVGIVAIALLAAAVLAMRQKRPGDAASDVSAKAVGVALALITACGLWLGSLEIDRFCATESIRFVDAGMARQTALSVYWGVYGIALVGVGFARRRAWLRYTGLSLLAVTLGKVVVIDMAKVESLYRVLSFLAVGLLFIGTSVAYAKLASRLLGTPDPFRRRAREQSGPPNPMPGGT
jgi:uncharacterized membrane protein